MESPFARICPSLNIRIELSDFSALALEGSEENDVPLSLLLVSGVKGGEP